MGEAGNDVLFWCVLVYAILLTIRFGMFVAKKRAGQRRDSRAGS